MRSVQRLMCGRRPTPLNAPLLRNALKKLRKIPLTGPHPAYLIAAPQEMLDFLAMLAGLKPVYLLGRGLDDPRWMGGVLRIAREMNLRTVEAPYWDAAPRGEGLMAQYRVENEVGPQKAFYITKSPAVADQVIRIRGQGQIAIEEEARLLGYPICCVEEHYRRAYAMNEGYALMLRRAGRGNDSEMRRLIAEDAPLSPETDDEKRLIEFATKIRCAPFTSVNMCEACAAGRDTGAAMRLGQAYRRLAMVVDPSLAAEINAINSWADAKVAHLTRG